ncbi:MAG: hypothetical protein ABI977_08740 [Acidobacteriota bacterium]
MAENQTTCDPIDYLIDSFWAILPEKTADDLANFKKDVLKGFRSMADSVVDSAIAETDRHLENARRMRQEWEAEDAAADAADAPPNPA